MSTKMRPAIGRLFLWTCVAFFGSFGGLRSDDRVKAASLAREERPILVALNRTASVVFPSTVRNVPMETFGEFPAAPGFPASPGAYPIASQDVSWRSREGATTSALVFYPLRPPVEGKKFPVVIYSHGLGGAPERFAYLASAWASRGIVTMCLRHPGSDESIWRGKIRAMSELKEAYQKYWPSRDRAAAMSSAIDFLYSIHETEGPLGRDLDLSKIGVAGNDLGALAALLVAGQLPPDNGASLKDERVAAVLALSPPVFCESEQGPVVYSLIETPTMSFSGTEDDGLVGLTKAYQRRIPFDSVRYGDRYLIVLQGGDHMVYGGHRMKTKQASDAPYQTLIRENSTLYWRAYLQDDADALARLRGAATGATLPNATFERILGDL